ncbi:septum formation initiator family protein [Corynebacterium striatum]
MARQNHTSKKSRTTVPVVSRATRQREAAAKAKAKGASQRIKSMGRMDIVGFAVILVVVLIVLLTIAVPLRNYYHVRSETARLERAIAAKQAEKEELLEEIDKYRSEDYLQQEARRRFGVIAEGETAYRIMDNRMNHNNTVTTDRLSDVDSRPWYEILWGSISEDEDTSVTGSTNTDPGHLPTVAPSSGPEAVPGQEVPAGDGEPAVPGAPAAPAAPAAQ